MKVTIDVEAGLYRAIKVEAARSDRSVREVVDEALAAWLEALEDAEDVAASDAAMAEYERDGGTDAQEVFMHLAAEVAARYETSEG